MPLNFANLQNSIIFLTNKTLVLVGSLLPAYAVKVSAQCRILDIWVRAECLTTELSLCSPQIPPVDLQICLNMCEFGKSISII